MHKFISPEDKKSSKSVQIKLIAELNQVYKSKGKHPGLGYSFECAVKTTDVQSYLKHGSRKKRQIVTPAFKRDGTPLPDYSAFFVLTGKDFNP